ncbi:bromodomain-containing protein 4 [Drosophila obscura]|uniref:bromodomain-containing protein 4 n=1 Tax=Drosophila obscura TaxID=7282 RepID=UPI001BB0FF39|nr:bromodomain-containing protein 4 [Drosophila obscura]
MRKNLSVISQDPKMASLTLHLMVIALLAAAAMTTVAATATAATRQRIRGVAPAVRGGGGVEGEGEATASTTSTEVPTLRAPRQRRPPTTQSIEIPLLSSRSRSRGLSRSSSSTTPIPTTPLPQAADKKQQQQQQQRRRFSTTTTTTPPTTVAPSARSLRDRGSVRGARQPRDTPALSSEFGGSSSSISRSWGQPQALPIPPGKASSLPTEHGHVAYSSSNFTSTSSVDSRSGGALKTPRMIHRLVAGHIQNAQGHSTYEVSAVSANSSHSASTSQPSTTTARSTATSRQPTALRGKGKASSSYRLAKPSPSPSPSPPYRDDNDDDEALLNEADDSFDNWDNGILRLSAGSGKEAEAEAEAPSKKPFKEDGKKTLADQVRDGKYGLIEKELFRRIPKRPGVLSYARNSEVPLDNERNYGGLNEQDIWLAEDHLLVIKGGSLNEDEGGGGGGQWPAIDDYDAPPRQIKLPANPAVPPPFPVQLEPHGPLQLIRDNQLEILHSAPGNATLSADASKQAPHQGYAPAAAHASHPAARAGAATAPKAAAPPYVYPAPYAPWLLYPNETTPGNGLLRSSPPLLGPWLINGLHANGSLAANAAVLPGNGSDFDEDDPSLYYPPAYSFVYKSNYSNLVPPGPLVPGIVLPPPPDHFSRLDTTTRRPPTSSSTTTTSTSTTSTTTATAPTTTSKTTPRPATTPLPLRTSYKPKYNAISYLPPPPRQHQPQHQHQPHPAPKYVERVPVPVAVPIPIYPINYTPRPQAQLVFVSSSTEGKAQDADPPLSKSNPIYYEYFEAKRQPGSIKSNVIDDFLPTKPPKRHHLQHHLHYKASVSPANDVTDVVNITPKPRNAQLQLSAEYDAALGQLLRSNLISAAPAAAAAAATGAAVGSGRFHPPDFDKQPFLPMVNYSADEQDQNAFKAIVYQPPPSRQRQLRVGKQQLQQQQQQHQQQQLQLDSTEDSYLPERQLRVGKQQQQQQQQQIYDSQIFSTPGPGPHYVEDQVHHLRPPAPVQTGTLQFWQRPPPQFKRVRQGSKHPHAHPHLHPYPPYFVPSYPSAPAGEPLYRLVPVAQHKHWRTKPQHPPQQSQQQSQPIQVHPQAQSYPDRAVNIGHSLAGDILVNYNTNNQFNSQAELVPQAQLAAPPLPPLSYQAQSGQGQGGPLWSEREKPGRQPRAQFTEQQQQQQQQ